MAEMKKTGLKFCRSCKYSKVFNSSNSYYCDYLCMTGKRRDCKLGECDKYEPKKEGNNHD